MRILPFFGYLNLRYFKIGYNLLYPILMYIREKIEKLIF
jgi:hypothetical protein